MNCLCAILSHSPENESNICKGYYPCYLRRREWHQQLNAHKRAMYRGQLSRETGKKDPVWEAMVGHYGKAAESMEGKGKIHNSSLWDLERGVLPIGHTLEVERNTIVFLVKVGELNF